MRVAEEEVVVAAVAADNQYRSRTARWRISKT